MSRNPFNRSLIYIFQIKRIFVRLGEHDLRTTEDAPHKDIVIHRSVPHKEFDPELKLNDIAIIYLSRDVEFSGEYKNTRI